MKGASVQIKLVQCQVFNLLKPTGHVMHQKVEHSITVRSARTVFVCFVFI
jgi:hypothetical protein